METNLSNLRLNNPDLYQSSFHNDLITKTKLSHFRHHCTVSSSLSYCLKLLTEHLRQEHVVHSSWVQIKSQMVLHEYHVRQEEELKPSVLKIGSMLAERHGASLCFCCGSCQYWKQSFVYQELACISAFASGARCYFNMLLCAIVDK